MKKNVATEIVRKGFCCGCGICGAIPGRDCISIEFNRIGEYEAVVKYCNECGSCLSVCPFSDNKNTIEPLDSDIHSYVGYSNMGHERKRGSSGGLITRILVALMEKNLIDGAIVVGASALKDRFFEPVIVRDPDDLIRYSGSKYYPIEFSAVLKKLKDMEGNYAIVALPCVVKGLRLFQKRFPEVGQKIKFIIGLVCGQNKNKYYTQSLLELLNIIPENVSTVDFRVKEGSKRASNFGFRALLKDGQFSESLYFQESVIKVLWCKRFFSLNACYYCKDLFAERADVCCMDAWLDQYMNDQNGTSVVLARNRQINDLLLCQDKDNNISIQPLAKEDVILSQKGGLDFKQKMSFKKFRYNLNSKFSNLLFLFLKDNAKLQKKLLLFYLKLFNWYV